MNNNTHDSPARLDAGEILASVGEALYRWDVPSDALTWSANAGEVLSIASGEAIATGRAFAQFLDTDNSQARFDAVMRSEQRDEGRGVGYRIQYCIRPDPTTDAKLWLEDTGRWFAGPDGKPVRAHGTVRAINDRHERETRLNYLARYDELTGEFNRHHLTEVLEKTLDDAIRFRSSCGFLLVAIDNLARINESYGFDIADEVINAVGKRIRGLMRGKDTLGRFSGNKFGIVLRDCTPDDMAIAAERLLAGVRDEMLPTERRTGCRHRDYRRRNRAAPCPHRRGSAGARAGGARQRQGQTPRLVPRLPAKSRARDAAPGERTRDRRDRRRAQRAPHFPRLRAGRRRADRKHAFYECLMRVRRATAACSAPAMSCRSPNGLDWCASSTTACLSLWSMNLSAAPALHTSVNVSPGSTTDPDWWAGLGSMLRTHSGVAERLIIEITESAAIHDIDETRGFVARVKDLGCRIAIDDFGAGYTSFRNLRKLGVDIVKIDGAFVQNMLRSEDDRAFVRTLIELGKRLKLATVAEWVQDEQAAKMLEAWGCDYLQGALVGLATVERPWRTGLPPMAARGG